jgi:hypothetical protein
MRLVAIVLATILGLAVPVALAAPTATVHPGQRVDLKVLLLSADGTEPGFGAWKAELEREGVPYKAIVADTDAAITESQLFDGDHAFYQAVILASGDLGHNVINADGTVSYLTSLSDPEWAAIAKLERTFGIRRLSDYTAPTPAHGLTTVGGAAQDGAVGTLTAAGQLAFPYLRGPVAVANDDAVAAEAFGYRATPVNAADWQTLVAAPDGTAYLGIYTHPDDGREEMVMTVASNQFQNHNQLLRHGMLNWVTRGVFLGYERSYLELDVDDVFLADDRWDATANTTDYDPAHAIRMTPADVASAVAWQNRSGLKLNMVYNMGGVDLYGGTAGDALLAAFRGVKNEFRWINHTLEHPNLDCTTAVYTARQFTENQARFASDLGGVAPGLNDPSELVAGEHSGIANTRPGNPGTIDPPSIGDAVGAAGGTLAAGTYDYGVTATTAAGETNASIASVAVPATGSAALSWPSVCHATSYKLYRRLGATGAWTLVTTLPPLSAPFTDAGAVDVSFTDTGAAGGAGAPPPANGAAIAPYPQNPSFVDALVAAGIKTAASDASKEYPSPPTASPVAEGAAGNLAKGAIFQDGPTLMVPRYPSNVYYNVANRADQLDEYNWIYTAPAGGGGCVQITGVTTCNTAPVDWPKYLSNETRIMFGHLVGNDARPHYFHQTNIAQADLTKAATDTTVGGTLYAVIDTLVARYEAAFDRSRAPLLQLTPTQIAATLVRQRDWAGSQDRVSAWLQDGTIHVKNTGATAVEVPLTGTTMGEPYGGQRSGWTALGAGAQLDLSPAEPALASAPSLSGTAKVGERLTATQRAWTGTAPIWNAYQWQRCGGDGCRNIAGATDAAYTVAGGDEGARVRVAVTAGNWVSSVSQAVSASSGVVASPPARRGRDRAGSPAAGGTRLALTRLKLSPRRFPVAHLRPRPGTRLDGTRISWRLNQAATVRLRFDRRAGKRWVRVGTITRPARAGTGVVRFRGRFGRKLLAPRRYRVVVTAVSGSERTAARRVSFRVVKG